MSLDLEYFPKFKCCCNQHLCLGENSSKCLTKIFRTESSLAQDEIQNLTQLRSPLPSPFIGGILSHGVAFPSLFAMSLFQQQTRQKNLEETCFSNVFRKSELGDKRRAKEGCKTFVLKWFLWAWSWGYVILVRKCPNMYVGWCISIWYNISVPKKH